MTLSSYLELIESQRQEFDALSFDVDPYFALDEAGKTAVRERLTQLADEGDTRAVASLGLIGDARVVPALERALAKGQAGSGLGARMLAQNAQRALFQVRAGAADEAAVAALLASDSEIERALTAAAVKEAVLPPLGDATRFAAARRLLPVPLHDQAVAARHHAGRAVAALHGLDAEALPRQHPVAVLLFALSTSLQRQWQAAAAALEQLLAPGATAPGYTPSADPSLGPQFWEALKPPSPVPDGWTPFALELVDGMGPDDRAWVETLLVARLALGDPHAPPAALSILGPRVRPYLEDAVVLNAPKVAFVAAAKKILASLDAPA